MSAEAAAAVSGERLWADLMAMAEVGATPEGGSSRLALTDDDRAGRELFSGWARDAGLELRADRAGNQFARRAGSDPGRPAVMAGSHLDTQPNGGRFDGVFGVLAALEAVRALNDAGIETAAPIDVVNWTNEEGGRFPQFCTGSAVYAGAATMEQVNALSAFDGPLYGEELDRVGFAGDEEPGSLRAAAYLELHIEQGPVLESEGLPLGVVRGIRGIRKFGIQLTGREEHAGSPMAGRRDALRAAARLLVDVRGEALDSPDELVSRLREEAVSVLAGSEVSVAVDDDVWDYGPVAFDPALLETLREAAARTGSGSLDMVSPAGHDAGYVARVVPTAMLFVPCRDGLSHHPAEWAEPAHLELATRVLADALAELAA